VELNKQIWFFWNQGMDKMPELVKNCYNSWKLFNRDYEVIFLDKNNLYNYVSIHPEILNNKNISIQALSDIIRINLLAQNGGVWVDATCFCVKPLDAWLEKYLENGFFAFSKPNSDKLISSWFLVSTNDNYIINKWCNLVNSYWIDNPELTDGGKYPMLSYVQLRLFPFLGIKYAVSFANHLTKYLNTYPYFYFHYLFNQAYFDDIQFKEIWDSTHKLLASGPHKLLVSGFDKKFDKEIENDFNNRITPLYKLSHKISYDPHKKNSVINSLFKLD